MKSLGLSGDKIITKGRYVYKTCCTDQDRFLKNVHKQQSFINPYMKSVPILDVVNKKNKCHIKMPYLKCPNAIEWISSANIEDIYQLSEKIILYLKYSFSNSSILSFDYEKWSSKITELNTKIKDSEINEILGCLQHKQFANHFYYGNYHGDLTLSNVFIHKDDQEIIIQSIDFLHSFMESPINDLVKLRQDTKHLWTLHLIKDIERIDVPRVLVLLNHMDKQIQQLIQEDAILSEYYIPFQILNLIRILPYTSNEETIIYLKREIRNLFYSNVQ